MRGREAWASGRYTEVLEVLRGRKDLSAEELALLGRCELRIGLYHDAELHLLRPHLAGVPDATVEYAEALRRLGRAGEARDHAVRHEACLAGAHREHLLHVRARAEHDLGRVAEAIRRAEGAGRAFLALGREGDAGAVGASLAAMHLSLGDTERAERLVRLALGVLPGAPDPGERLRALHVLFETLLVTDREEAAEAVWDEALGLIDAAPTPRARADFLWTRVRWHDGRGEEDHRARAFADLQSVAPHLPDPDVQARLWTHAADLLSRAGRHGAALAAAARTPAADAEVWRARLTDGVLARRRGDAAGAVRELGRVVTALAGSGRVLEEAPARLELVRALVDAARDDEAELHLSVVVRHAVRAPALAALRRALPDDPLVERLAARPTLAPYVEALRLAGREPPRPAALRLATLGRSAAWLDGRLLDGRLNVALALSLALHPWQTRRDLELRLYPDRPPAAATAAVKFSLAAMRRLLGDHALVREGPYHAQRYALSGALRLELDLLDLHEALRREDLSRALDLYAGPLLPDFEGSEWLDGLREEARSALHELVVRRIAVDRAAGRAEDAHRWCDAYLARDPYDLDLQRTRVELAESLGSPLLVARSRARLEGTR